MLANVSRGVPICRPAYVPRAVMEREDVATSSCASPGMNPANAPTRVGAGLHRTAREGSIVRRWIASSHGRRHDMFLCSSSRTSVQACEGITQHSLGRRVLHVEPMIAPMTKPVERFFGQRQSETHGHNPGQPWAETVRGNLPRLGAIPALEPRGEATWRHVAPGKEMEEGDGEGKPGYAAETLDTLQEGTVGHTQKSVWQDELRRLTKRKKHHEWEHLGLDPPPVLDKLCVVMVAPKIPRNVGAVARTCGAFECMDLRIINPRYQFHLARVARNTAKGSQHIMFGSRLFGSLANALDDCDYSVALTRWADARPGQPQYEGMAALLADTPAGRLDALPPGRKLALVLGREDAGFLPQEIRACHAVASIPMGRLQESLSIGHAVSIALAAFFDHHCPKNGVAQK